MIKHSKEIQVPKADPYFFLPEEIIGVLDRLEKLSRKHPVNVLVTGKQGCGKSSLVRQFSARYEHPMSSFQIGLLSEPGQLFGEQRLKEGETYYQQFLFPQAISTPGCVLHLEELNRPEHPKALNELFSVLSEDRCIWVDELGLVSVAEKVLFFATLNEGEEFTGIDQLDAALRDRFYVIQMDYLPWDVEQQVLMLKTGVEEEQAVNILRVINKLRSNTQVPIAVSTRHSLMIAELVVLGASIREAIIFSLQLDKDMLESLLLSLHLETGDTKVAKSAYRVF